MRKTLTTIGTSLGIVIDKPVLEVLGIKRTTVLNVEVRDGSIVIRPEPARGATSRDEFEEWARSLLVRFASANDGDAMEAVSAEFERFEQLLPTLMPSASRRKKGASVRDTQAWLERIVQQQLADKPPPAKPIITREVSRAVLEELSDARGTFREITASRPYANASPDVVAQVLWFLIVRGYVEVHSDSRRIRPALDRLRDHGRIDVTGRVDAHVPEVPEQLADALKHGVTLLRLTPAGGEYLHQLRREAG